MLIQCMDNHDVSRMQYIPTKNRTVTSVSKFLALARTMVSTLQITSMVGIYRPLSELERRRWQKYAYPYGRSYPRNQHAVQRCEYGPMDGRARLTYFDGIWPRTYPHVHAVVM